MTAIAVTRLRPDAHLPRRAHADDAGWDLAAADDGVLTPGERALIPTGIAIALPAGMAALVVPRSGLARDHGIGIVNGPGLIDAGYRGEIGVLLVNHDPVRSFTVERGMRIAQLVIIDLPDVTLVEAGELPEGTRGAAGFGSSGSHA